MKTQSVVTYWRIIKKRGWLPLLLLLVTVGTIVGLSLLAEPVYVASVRFQVVAPPPGDVSLFQGARLGSLREEMGYARDNFISIITSRDVAWRVVEQLNLEMSGGELAELVVVEPVLGSDFTEITVSTDDPNLSAAIANTLMVEGIAKFGEISARGSANSREFVLSQLNKIGAQLAEAQQELVTYKIENKVGDLDDLISSQQGLIRSLNLARDQAWAEGKLEAATNYDKIIAERTLELQDLVQLGTEYTVLQGKVQQLSQTYDFLLEKETEAELKENEILNLGYIQPLGEARVPSEPEPAIQTSIVILGAVLSLVLGVVIIFLWEYLDKQRALAAVDLESRNSEKLLPTESTP
ncbi:MAG: hypothetical protein L6R45_29560 [Anaerolineae bacterium]|nr:hypothetical protein [Anaerolineae bacterium]